MGNLYSTHLAQNLLRMASFPNLSITQIMASIFIVSSWSLQWILYETVSLQVGGIVYYMQNVESEAKFARELHERVRREFPEVRIRWIRIGIGCCLIYDTRFVSTSCEFINCGTNQSVRFGMGPLIPLILIGPKSGPHPTAMFEVNTFDPHQTGAFFSWLVVNRGPCSWVHSLIFLRVIINMLDPNESVLVHPNTGNVHKDHTDSAAWIGRPWPLNVEMLKAHRGHWYGLCRCHSENFWFG